MKNCIIILASIVFSIAGCKTLHKLTQFNMPYDQSIVIPGTTGINLPLNIQTPDMPTNSQSTFSVNNTSKDLIDQIKLTSLELTLTSPTTGDFNFLKSVHIYISATGMSETEIAWKDNIPDSGTKTLQLDVSGTDLKEYIKKNNISLRVNTVTDELLTTDHQINAHCIFFVDAKILGL